MAESAPAAPRRKRRWDDGDAGSGAMQALATNASSAVGTLGANGAGHSRLPGHLPGPWPAPTPVLSQDAVDRARQVAAALSQAKAMATAQPAQSFMPVGAASGPPVVTPSVTLASGPHATSAAAAGTAAAAVATAAVAAAAAASRLILEREVLINDAPPAVRGHLLKKSVHTETERRHNVVIATRGRFYAPGAVPDPRERPLHLLVKPSALPGQTDDQRAACVAAAADDLLRMLAQGAPPGGPPPPGTPANPHTTPQPHAAPPIATHSPPPPPVWIFVNIHSVPPVFGLPDRIRGPGGAFLGHVASTTGATVALRGRGSVTLEGPDPLHVFVSAPSQRQLDDAVVLVMDLLHTVKGELVRRYPETAPYVGPSSVAPQPPAPAFAPAPTGAPSFAPAQLNFRPAPPAWPPGPAAGLPHLGVGAGSTPAGGDAPSSLPSGVQHGLESTTVQQLAPDGTSGAAVQGVAAASATHQYPGHTPSPPLTATPLQAGMGAPPGQAPPQPQQGWAGLQPHPTAQQWPHPPSHPPAPGLGNSVVGPHRAWGSPLVRPPTPPDAVQSAPGPAPPQQPAAGPESRAGSVQPPAPLPRQPLAAQPATQAPASPPRRRFREFVEKPASAPTQAPSYLNAYINGGTASRASPELDKETDKEMAGAGVKPPDRVSATTSMPPPPPRPPRNDATLMPPPPPRRPTVQPQSGLSTDPSPTMLPGLAAYADDDDDE